VREGRVRVDGSVVRDLAFRVVPETARIEVDGAAVTKTQHVYLALNKPRGLVTTRDDPQGRATIYDCLDDSLPFVGPVGRLDKASEGLLLLTNDTRWADRLLAPDSHVDKTYHVQVAGHDLTQVAAHVEAGVAEPATGERLTVKSIGLLRSGSRSTAWYEVVLDEGKNRQLRRIFESLGLEVRRLVRVAIGPLALGDLAKGEWRHLTAAEVTTLSGPAGPHPRERSR
jgi:23S rRNA pseudouridine2605 synthase